MNAAVSLVGVVVLVLSATFAGAQDGPLIGAIRTEALRLAAQSDLAVQPNTNSDDPAWARVTHLPVAAEVEILQRDRPSLKVLFASADATSLTVVNLGDVAVTENLRQEIGAMLRRYPEAFTKARPIPVGKGSLRLGVDGLFAGRRKLAERDELIAVIDRAAVLKIVKTETPSSWLNGKSGALIGLGIGAALGYAAGSRCGAGAAQSECRFYGTMVAIFSGAAGAGVGALIGSDLRAIPEKTLVYSAP